MTCKVCYESDRRRTYTFYGYCKKCFTKYHLYIVKQHKKEKRYAILFTEKKGGKCIDERTDFPILVSIDNLFDIEKPWSAFITLEVPNNSSYGLLMGNATDLIPDLERMFLAQKMK